MPTNRKRKSRKIVSSTISEPLRRYLLTGELSQDAGVFQLSGNRAKLRLVWDAVKKEILAEFVPANPCTRPFCFWLLAGEKRKKLKGSGGWHPGMAIDAEGLPNYWQLHWSKKNPPVFESQATFLQRNSLLTPTEKAYLKKHPALMKPERVEFDKE